MLTVQLSSSFTSDLAGPAPNYSTNKTASVKMREILSLIALERSTDILHLETCLSVKHELYPPFTSGRPL